MARRIQNRLALAQFKAKHGWEDLTLDTLEPKFEEEFRRKRISDGDVLSDSSSSTSDLPYPTRALMSSPLKATIFSDVIGSGSSTMGHRKRTYMASFDNSLSSPSKRFRGGPAGSNHRSFTGGHTSWKDSHQLAQSSPIKPRRQQHFTTATGPDVSFFAGSRTLTDSLTSPNFAGPSDDDDDLLPTHSFQVDNVRSSPPSTPPMRSRHALDRRNKEKGTGAAASSKTGEEGADLLLYLAASPSPANPLKHRMDAPSTPPPKNKLALPSSMMTTPGGGNPFLNTPGLAFDFSDFVHMTPSPAQKPWKTPAGLGVGVKTPMSVARRRLTYDDLP